jgi:hypothetical protein
MEYPRRRNIMDAKRISFLLFGLSLIAFIFIRSYFIEKADFQNRLEGILRDKKKASRGFYDIYVYDKNLNKTIKKEYNNISTYYKIIIGDSVIKKNNSLYIQVYRNFGKGYQFVDSFGIGRGTN